MLEDLKKTLWATADKLRANMDAAEYKHLVLGLVFVKYISDTFSAKQAELTRRFADPADEYFLPDSTAEQQHAELEDRDYYREVNVFWVPEDARWEALRSGAKQPDIGKRVDDALSLIADRSFAPDTSNGNLRRATGGLTIRLFVRSRHVRIHHHCQGPDHRAAAGA
jgi:type I restriction enzyme M protein